MNPAVPTVTTVFRDDLPHDHSYVLKASDAARHFESIATALYFVHGSTWAKQVLRHAPSPLPLLRLMPSRPNLRIGNERVSHDTASCHRHLVIYSLPSALRSEARSALLDKLTSSLDVTSPWLITYEQRSRALAVVAPGDWI